MDSTEIIQTLLRAFTFVMLYMMIGFGPGFLIGVLLGNRFGGGYKQMSRMDESQKQIEKAALHNAQWHPDHERWKKS